MDTDLLSWLGGFLAAVLVYGAVVLMSAGFDVPEGKPMDEKTTEEKKPAAPLLDFNGNGVPDYREPWFWQGVWTAFRTAVLTFAKPHTLIYKGVEAAEKARGGAA